MAGAPQGLQAQPRWQDQFADPEWQAKLTRLSPQEEQDFSTWSKINRAPDTPDYDMRGFWKSGGATQVSPLDGRPHYTDQFKTPLHESFSGESMYSIPGVPKPSWNDKSQLVHPDGSVLFDEPALVKQRQQLLNTNFIG